MNTIIPCEEINIFLQKYTMWPCGASVATTSVIPLTPIKAKIRSNRKKLEEYNVLKSLKRDQCGKTLLQNNPKFAFRDGFRPKIGDATTSFSFK